MIIKKKNQKKMVSESQSLDEQQIEIVKQNINQSKNKQKPDLKKIQSITYSRISNNKQGELKNLNNKKNRRQSSSSSESQPCSEKLPTCFEKQKQKQKPIAADKKPLPINKSSKLLSGKLRSIIKGSQSSQSEISEKKIKTVNISEKIIAKQPKILQNTKVISKIPIALRNQTTKKSFNQYQEQKWLSVTKDILKKWNHKGFNVFCQINNKIRFKTIQLDEQRFIPIKSNWIIGEVKQITQNNKITLTKVYQEGQQFRDHFDIPEHNMQDLQIFQNLATKDQLEVFRQNSKPQQVKAQKKIELVSSQLEKNEQNDKNSVEKFICGQINFYFSDKNYSTDLYMQMHANRNPQKCNYESNIDISIAFLLNFPKIKKILRDQNKLFQYLTEDENYQKRNYQINMQSKMIRKKIINDKNQDKATIINKMEDKLSSENQQNIELAQNSNNSSN